MTDKKKTDINSWRRLYAAADQIKKLAPWQWMEETDIFGVQFPGTELMQATEGLHQMWEEIPAKLVSILNKAKFKPKEIRVSSPRLYQFMEPVHKELGIEMSFHEDLPAIRDVKQSMRDFMLNRK